MKKLFTFFVLGGLLLVLLSSISELPPVGDKTNPSYNEVAEYYISNSAEETGSTNIIAAIITDYRAFDTLGETTVLFTGIAAVVSLVGISHHKEKKEEGDNHG